MQQHRLCNVFIIVFVVVLGGSRHHCHALQFMRTEFKLHFCFFIVVLYLVESLLCDATNINIHHVHSKVANTLWSRAIRTLLWHADEFYMCIATKIKHQIQISSRKEHIQNSDVFTRSIFFLLGRALHSQLCFSNGIKKWSNRNWRTTRICEILLCWSALPSLRTLYTLQLNSNYSI